jgi:hypothetical protein
MSRKTRVRTAAAADAAPADVLAKTEQLIVLNRARLGYDDPQMLHPGDVVYLDDPAATPVMHACRPRTTRQLGRAEHRIGAETQHVRSHPWVQRCGTPAGERVAVPDLGGRKRCHRRGGRPDRRMTPRPPRTPSAVRPVNGRRRRPPGTTPASV